MYLSIQLNFFLSILDVLNKHNSKNLTQLFLLCFQCRVKIYIILSSNKEEHASL